MERGEGLGDLAREKVRKACSRLGSVERKWMSQVRRLEERLRMPRVVRDERSERTEPDRRLPWRSKVSRSERRVREREMMQERCWEWRLMEMAWCRQQR